MLALKSIHLCLQFTFGSWPLGISITFFVKAAVHLKWMLIIILSIFSRCFAVGESAGSPHLQSARQEGLVPLVRCTFFI